MYGNVCMFPPVMVTWRTTPAQILFVTFMSSPEQVSSIFFLRTPNFSQITSLIKAFLASLEAILSSRLAPSMFLYLNSALLVGKAARDVSAAVSDPLLVVRALNRTQQLAMIPFSFCSRNRVRLYQNIFVLANWIRWMQVQVIA